MAKEPPGGQLRDALAPPVQRCTHKSETLLRNTTKARYGRSEWNKKRPGGVSEGRFAGKNWRASGRERYVPVAAEFHLRTGDNWNPPVNANAS